MSNITNDKMKRIIELEGNLATAAKLYMELGFRLAPLSKSTLSPAVDLTEWIEKAKSPVDVAKYFIEHQNSCLGLLLCDSLVVFQVSSKSGERFLFGLERKHGAAPSFITEDGGVISHYFLLGKGVSIPEELLNDGSQNKVAIKTAGQVVAVPPTAGVTLQSAWFKNAEDLNEIDQSFIDDLLAEPVQESPQETSNHHIEDNIPSTLAAYGINKLFADVENAPEAEALLDGFIMRGEMTTIYAEAGSGKTLLVLHLIKKAIEKGFKNPTHFGYINKDDSGPGLVEKVKFADTLNVKVIADAKGHNFRRDDFLIMLKKCIAKGEAEQTVFVVDTLKKLASINDKDSASRFYNAVRPFTLAGGTLVFLAHTNKYKNDGKSVYAGTSDNIQDVDAAFSLDIISEGSAEHHERIVLLECVKSRMASVSKMMFGYNASENMKWTDRLNTVRRISDDEFAEIQDRSSRSRDLEIITSISETLRMGGQMQKMKLAKSVCEDTGCSRKEALAVLDNYTGSDPKKHEWNFKIGPRGAKLYSLVV